MFRRIISVCLLISLLVTPISLTAQAEPAVNTLLRGLYAAEQRGQGEAMWNGLSLAQRRSVINAIRTAPVRTSVYVSEPVQRAAVQCKTVLVRNAKQVVVDAFALYHEVYFCYNGRVITELEWDVWPEAYLPLQEYIGLIGHRTYGGRNQKRFTSRPVGYFCTYDNSAQAQGRCAQHTYLWIKIVVTGTGDVITTPAAQP